MISNQNNICIVLLKKNTIKKMGKKLYLLLACYLPIVTCVLQSSLVFPYQKNQQLTSVNRTDKIIDFITPSQLALALKHKLDITTGHNPSSSKLYSPYISANNSITTNLIIAKKIFLTDQWQTLVSLSVPLNAYIPNFNDNVFPTYNNTSNIKFDMLNMYQFLFESEIEIVEKVQFKYQFCFENIQGIYNQPPWYLLSIRQKDEVITQVYDYLAVPSLTYRWNTLHKTSISLYFKKHIDMIYDGESFQSYPLNLNHSKVSWGFIHSIKYRESNLYFSLQQYNLIYNDELLDHQHLSMKFGICNNLPYSLSTDIYLKKSTNNFSSSFYQSDRIENISSIFLQISWKKEQNITLQINYTFSRYKNYDFQEYDMDEKKISFELRYYFLNKIEHSFNPSIIT